jgi:hypothetical protein
LRNTIYEIYNEPRQSTLTASGKLARRIIKSWDTIDYDGAQ